MALVQEAAPAPAVHGELVVEAVGEAAAGAQLPPSHCYCGILLPSSTIVTSSYIFSSSLRSPGCPGLGAVWRVAAGAGCAGWRLAARARAGTTGSSRCGRGRGGWAETLSASAVTKVCIRAGNDPSRSFVSSSSVHQLTIYTCVRSLTPAPRPPPWCPPGHLAPPPPPQATEP